MRVAIFGLGYVGAVTGSCLASYGNSVTLIDINSTKVETFLSGRSPISEPGLEELIRDGLAKKMLNATSDAQLGLVNADCILVSVGTPSNNDTGAPDLSALESVAKDIARYLMTTKTKVAIALCSTVPPNTTEGFFRSLLHQKGVSDEKYFLSFMPEFLREGSAIKDFHELTRFIIGVASQQDANIFTQLRPDLSLNTYVVETRVAEMLKTVENSWHALKIVFANEVSRISESMGIDAREVMRLLSLDKKQNISAAYLRPGFAFGGSCLPKDLRSLTFLAELQNVQTPVLSNIHESNNIHISVAAEAIKLKRPKKVTILGLAFKANTDDLRESPIIKIIDDLSKNNVLMKVHDFNVSPQALIGANRVVWETHPKLPSIFEGNLDIAVKDADLIVVAQYEKRYREKLQALKGRTQVMNLAGL